MRALYRGFIPTVCGMIPYAGLSFYCFESFKYLCMKYLPGKLMQKYVIIIIFEVLIKIFICSSLYLQAPLYQYRGIGSSCIRKIALWGSSRLVIVRDCICIEDSIVDEVEINWLIRGLHISHDRIIQNCFEILRSK